MMEKKVMLELSLSSQEHMIGLNGPSEQSLCLVWVFQICGWVL